MPLLLTIPSNMTDWNVLQVFEWTTRCLQPGRGKMLIVWKMLPIDNRRRPKCASFWKLNYQELIASLLIQPKELLNCLMLAYDKWTLATPQLGYRSSSSRMARRLTPTLLLLLLFHLSHQLLVGASSLSSGKSRNIYSISSMHHQSIG